MCASFRTIMFRQIAGRVFTGSDTARSYPATACRGTGSGQHVASEVAAALHSFVVLFGEHRADEAGQGQPSATASLGVSPSRQHRLPAPLHVGHRRRLLRAGFRPRTAGTRGKMELIQLLCRDRRRRAATALAARPTTRPHWWSSSAMSPRWLTAVRSPGRSTLTPVGRPC